MYVQVALGFAALLQFCFTVILKRAEDNRQWSCSLEIRMALGQDTQVGMKDFLSLTYQLYCHLT